MPNQPLNTLPKYNLFGLDEIKYEAAKVVALPIPYDSTSTYRAGSREGPKAIIEASRQMELYSYELDYDPSEIGIYTMDELAPDVSSPENMLASIKKEVGLLIDDKKVPLLLGGEHTISMGALQAFKERGREVSVLHFDAHADSRNELNNSRYSHATVMARAKELYGSVFQLGIRSIDRESMRSVNKERVLFMDALSSITPEEAADRINASTLRDVYLTFDLDVLDPSEMPSVGTPEPGGMHFTDLVKIIKKIGRNKNLVGMDFTELVPIPYMHAPNFLAAKLIYLTLGSFFVGR